METKLKIENPKIKSTTNGSVKKKISKFMQGANKFKGAFDKNEVLNYINS